MRDELPDISGEHPLGAADETLASAGEWRPDELGEILSHQLSVPLAVDLFQPLPDVERARLSDLAEAAVPRIVTFRDLLLHPAPPVELLTLTRAFTRRHNSAARAGMPRDVSRALDTAAAAAGVLQGLDTGPVDPAALAWLASLACAGGAIQALAASARERLKETPSDQSDLPRHDAVPSATSPAVAFAPTVDGYEITGRLGEGGMGVVWRAVQLSTGRPVALKLMSAASFGSERARLRFEREVRVAAYLDHPQIAAVYESGLHRGAYYYAMKLVEGRPLDQYVRQEQCGVVRILRLMRSVCGAVQYAHRKGIVHRDLKPGNILVDRSGLPHLLDLGLAKALQDSWTATAITADGEFAGTPAYMAPEQMNGSPSDCYLRTDVYALGVILFHLLTGEFPHDMTGSRLDVFRRIGQTNPRRLTDILPDADPGLSDLLAKALAPRPQDRFADAGELGVAIDRYLETAGRFAPDRLVRRRRRRILRIAGLAAGVAVLLGVVATVLVLSLRPVPVLDGGPSIGGRLYVNPGQPYVLRLRPGRVGSPAQAWQIDWGDSSPTQHLAGDATDARHIYQKVGRFDLRAKVRVENNWYRAATGSRPIYRWTDPEGRLHSYCLTERRGDWEAVQSECVSRKGLLVSITTADEQAFLQANALNATPAPDRWCWIGLTSKPRYGYPAGQTQFTWDDGSNVDKHYRNWATGEPGVVPYTQSAAMVGPAADSSGARPGEWIALPDPSPGRTSDTPPADGHGIAEFEGEPPAELLVVVTDVFVVKDDADTAPTAPSVTPPTGAVTP